MVKIPGSSGAPIVPPTPPRRKEEAPEIRHKPVPVKGGVPNEIFELDSRAIAVRMAALATDAKARDLSFDEIVEKVIKETGLSEAQAAMEEANRKIQKEIDEELDKIKQNKELMEEAAAWQELANILEAGMSSDQVKEFLSMIDDEIKKIK
jgi:DNA polymerase III delta prime subunit